MYYDLQSSEGIDSIYAVRQVEYTKNALSNFYIIYTWKTSA